MMKKRIGALIGCVLLATFACVASGTLITFDLSVAYSGDGPPDGMPPWVSATFDDGGTDGSVTMMLTDSNLSTGEFAFNWLFNLDQALDPTDLIFSAPTKTGKFDDPIVSTAADDFQADGDGMFDIEIAFANSDGAPKRFGPDDAVEYTITGIASLNASSFNFISAPDGGQGQYHTVAHLGNTGTEDGSVWVTVPEPATLALLALGGLALIRRSRR